ncbi:MAG: response regulator [Fischerella sp.]|jgi:signal transduction histidine kinase/DNA-binding NarL/FixJ family response regulator|uniref:ATP-binding protein n=1 Tax=Fischerella sp. TaxID=1191 RepID=UPI0017F6C71E|nr:ATP-binding protein [Fischerella sp.]NWF62416.1 response regulator [Fischerella sp.]
MPYASTLLIIDDCAADRKIYRRFLQKDPHQSYQILEADSAGDALSLCQETRCDVILLDFCLPDMSGLDFLDRLRRQKLEISIPVIMLTGRGDEEVAVQAMKRGVQDYLVKQHVKPDVLQLAVRNAIKQSWLQTQLNKTQERQRLIAAMLLRIRQSLDLEQILHTAVVEVQQLLKCDRVMVCQLFPEIGVKTVACSGEYLETTYNTNSGIAPPDQLITGGFLSHSGWLQTSTWHKQKSNSLIFPSVTAKVYEAELSDRCLNSLEAFYSETNLVVPITLSNNGESTSKPWGFLIADEFSLKREWQSDELEILHEVSVQLAIAIQQAELLAQTQAALQKEKQLNTFKSQIVATISHEYRTPLASILAAASTLKQHGELLEECKKQKFLQIIEQKARHMSKLMDDMLVVNQFELDKAKFKPILLDLLPFFSALIEEQQEIASDRHELIFNCTGNYKGFWGDRGLLRLIFTNLMSNAIKYSPNGGKVEFHLIGKESQIIFYVQDWGIGIPIEDQENLFQPFSRGSNVDTISGTGLGLAIAKACVELHGGSIALESQIGLGTKVIVSLPKRHNQGSS